MDLNSMGLHREDRIPRAGGMLTHTDTRLHSSRDTDTDSLEPVCSSSHQPGSVYCAGNCAYPRLWVPRWPGRPRALTEEQLSAHTS